MAKRHGFNRSQKRDRNGRWVKAGGSAVSSHSARLRANKKNISRRNSAIRLGIAFAPLVLPAALAGVGSLDTLIQSATHNRVTANDARYQAGKKVAAKALGSIMNASRSRRGVYTITGMSGRRI